MLGYTKYHQGGGGNNKRPTKEVGTKMVNSHKYQRFHLGIHSYSRGKKDTQYVLHSDTHPTRAIK